ncbi:histidine kinase [Fictibacillus phosphorivorans]|uniref:Histidine kinase n=1 Tax=Fictibacillus phosphorivorans TaxID=1221500 RepID=A0A160IR73_9BACL|nr:sensor histidine kinase [Fictibacillus phosphorivorans]ANC78747.1 histidine kinase [Fictibacillus phosphorivorans]
MKSIHSRLLLMLLGFIIVPYFLTIFLIYAYTKNSVEEYELNNSKMQLEKNAEDLQQYFDDMVNLPYILYRNPDLFRIFTEGFEDSIYFDQDSVEKSIETFYLTRNEIRQLRFYLNEGKESFTVYNATVSTRKPQPDLLNREHIKQLFKSNKNYLIEPPHVIKNYNNAAIIPESDRTKVLSIHHKIKEVPSDKFLGIMTMDISLGEYSKIVSNLAGENGSSAYLINDRNEIMYAKDSSLIGKRVPANLQSRIKKGTTDKEISLTKTLDGPVEGWKLVKKTPSDVLFRDVRETATINIIVGLGVGLLGLLMISFISYKISRPIRELSEKVRGIEGGHIEIPFENERQDEIGHLERHIKDMTDRINLHINREYKLEIENRRNQFRALKSQVNPHFLFNALQSIGAVALRSKSPQVYGLITSLSKMMRYSMQANQWVSVQNEVDYMKAYLNLQQARFGKELHYSLDFSDEVLESRIPSMILQPLVENFFKHVYEEGFYEAELTVSAEVKGDSLYLVVENNKGPEITASDLERLRENIYRSASEGTPVNEHIGLKNIYQRLILNYGTRAGFLVDQPNGQGFSVTIVIPKDSSYEPRV